MNSHKLLLLLVTVLLPQAFPLSARNTEKTFAFRQEYGDTTNLLSESTQELRKAYDLLEVLKRHSQDITSPHNTLLAQQTKLPKDLDIIRDRMIKQQLITVLSATPFSDPEKHTADCKTAISALESYTHTIQAALQTNQAPTQSAPTPALLANLTKTYDLGIINAQPLSTPSVPTQSPAVTEHHRAETAEMPAPLPIPEVISSMPTPTLPNTSELLPQAPVPTIAINQAPQPEAPVIPIPELPKSPEFTPTVTLPELPKTPEVPATPPFSEPTQTQETAPTAVIPDILTLQNTGIAV
jgi:hypothetical protein